MSVVFAPRRIEGSHARRPGRDELLAMTVRQLVAICRDAGIDVPKKPRKADLVSAIEASS